MLCVLDAMLCSVLLLFYTAIGQKQRKSVLCKRPKVTEKLTDVKKSWSLGSSEAWRQKVRGLTRIHVGVEGHSQKTFTGLLTFQGLPLILGAFL